VSPLVVCLGILQKAFHQDIEPDDPLLDRVVAQVQLRSAGKMHGPLFLKPVERFEKQSS
jgi:hypothetical protein